MRPAIFIRLAIALACFVALPSKAVDPLPPHIENASPEIQRLYRDRQGRDSLEMKRKVGEERYTKRMATKHAIMDAMQREAAVRYAEVVKTQGGARANEAAAETRARLFPALLIASAILIGVWKRHSLLGSVRDRF